MVSASFSNPESGRNQAPKTSSRLADASFDTLLSAPDMSRCTTRQVVAFAAQIEGRIDTLLNEKVAHPEDPVPTGRSFQEWLAEKSICDEVKKLVISELSGRLEKTILAALKADKQETRKIFIEICPDPDLRPYWETATSLEEIGAYLALGDFEASDPRERAKLVIRMVNQIPSLEDLTSFQNEPQQQKPEPKVDWEEASHPSLLSRIKTWLDEDRFQFPRPGSWTFIKPAERRKH